MEIRSRKGKSPSKMQSSLRLDTITMMDNSTHVASSPDARSPKLNHKFEA